MAMARIEIRLREDSPQEGAIIKTLEGSSVYGAKSSLMKDWVIRALDELRSAAAKAELKSEMSIRAFMRGVFGDHLTASEASMLYETYIAATTPNKPALVATPTVTPVSEPIESETSSTDDSTTDGVKQPKKSWKGFSGLIAGGDSE